MVEGKIERKMGSENNSLITKTKLGVDSNIAACD